MTQHGIELSLNNIQKEWHGTTKAYVTGFCGSLLLTVLSFSLVITKALSGSVLVYTLVGLGLAQAILQLLFFLHLGQEAKPRWETIVFGFMFLVLLLIAGGSLWIMYDLEDRVMSEMNSPQEMTHD